MNRFAQKQNVTFSRHLAKPLFRISSVILMTLVAILLRSLPAHAQTAQVRYTQTTISYNFNKPAAITYDPTSGALYVMDQGADAVYKLTPATGVYTQSTVVTGLLPIGIAVDSAGNVLVADNQRNIFKFTPNSTGYTQTTLLTGSYGIGLSVDSAGDLFFSNGSNITKATPAGGSYTLAVIDSGFSNVASMALDSAGNLYVADSSSNVVSKETLTGGTYTRSQIGSGFSQPLSVSLDALGDVYVADSNNARIVKEAPSGTGYTQAVTIPLMYATPGATTDPAGNIYDIIYFEQAGINKISPVEEADAPALAFGSLPIGTQSSAMSATFDFLVGGTLATNPYTVVTQGNAALDFQPSVTQQTNVCISGHAYNVGDTCTVTVTFKPSFPGTRYGGIELVNTAGAVVGTAYMTGYGTGALVSRPPFFLYPAFTSPEEFSGLAVDAAGNIFFNDVHNGIGEKNATTGVVTIPVPGTTLSAGSPIAIDGNGNLYEYGPGANSSVGNGVRVSMLVNGAYSATNSVVVGSNLAGAEGCIAVDSAGNIFVADTENNRIVKETYLGGAYSQSVPLSGLGGPKCIAVDGSGDLFISDSKNNRVLMEAPGAGTYTQTVLTSNVSAPYGVALDAIGNLYIADSGNYRILRETLASGKYTESVYASFGANTGPETVYYLAIDPSGNLFGTNNLGDYQTNIFEYGVQLPQSLTFAPTAVGSTSSDSPQTVSVINIGNAPLTFDVPASGLNPAPSAGFQYSNSSTCPQLSTTSSTATLAPNATCTQSISFVPVSAGTITGTLTTTDNNLNADDSTQIVKLNGTATGSAPATATLTPATANFGSVQIGATASIPLTLTNTGTTTINITGVGIPSTLFTLTSQTCSSTLAANASCTYTITYTPTATGAVSSSFSVTDDAGTQTSVLNGTGLAAGSLSIAPTAITFSATNVGATATTMTSTITNSTANAIYLSSGALTDATDFTQSNNCNGIVGSGSSCVVSFSFTPQTTGALSSTYTIHDLNTPNVNLTVVLAGNGVAAPAPQAALTPASANFGNLAPGQTSAAQSFTLSNAGNAALPITSVSLTGANASAFTLATNTCGMSLAAGASCSVSITFKPTVAGSFSASLSIVDAVGTQTSFLTGAAVSATPADFSLAAAPPAQSTYRGLSVQYALQLQSMTSTNPFTGTVVFTATTLPAGVTASFSPASVVPGVAQPVNTTMTLTVPALQARNAASPWHGSAPVGATLAGLFACVLLGRRKRQRLPRLLLLLTCGLGGAALTLTGCGTGNGFGTPTTTSVITVTATSGTTVHSTTVTLTIQ